MMMMMFDCLDTSAYVMRLYAVGLFSLFVLVRKVKKRPFQVIAQPPEWKSDM